MHLSHRTTFNSQVSHVALIRDNKFSPGAKTQEMSGDTAVFRVCHDVYLSFHGTLIATKMVLSFPSFRCSI